VPTHQITDALTPSRVTKRTIPVDDRTETAEKWQKVAGFRGLTSVRTRVDTGAMVIGGSSAPDYKSASTSATLAQAEEKQKAIVEQRTNQKLRRAVFPYVRPPYTLCAMVATLIQEGFASPDRTPGRWNACGSKKKSRPRKAARCWPPPGHDEFNHRAQRDQGGT
jgi:hypothetical protein